MVDEPFQLAIETPDICFTSFFKTQGKAESYLRRWAQDRGYMREEYDDYDL
jgi:hypothetical protein